ncbi:hypothetical protein RHGRI_024238 [Rhododendron griersonianum]|uniref:DUF2828 domain-containing protein n=1 Tax=Rhododendron griersonianum TaxID=479676 RepID=A0AAV6J8W9_9ERIC|nr:hypothetical protein RHGRI_024238 [Rhododendron griersonianum]
MRRCRPPSSTRSGGRGGNLVGSFLQSCHFLLHGSEGCVVVLQSFLQLLNIGWRDVGDRGGSQTEGKPFHLEHYLEMAWNHNPLATLKIICFWRGARETGKPIRESFYRIALRIHRNHPKTLANNLEAFARYGYLKDLLEILHRFIHGWENSSAAVNYNTSGQTVEKNLIKTVRKDDAINMKRRRKRTILMAKEAVEKYKNDPNYQFLHNLVTDIFAKLLKSDMELLKCEGISKISLAAKWCPSLGSSYDRSTLICESISRRMFPLDSDPKYKEMEEAHYAYRVRDRLRKQVLDPLREALNLPESFKRSKIERSVIQDTVFYGQVGYVALLKYKKLWLKKDGHPPISHAWDKLVEGRVFQFPHNLMDIIASLGLLVSDMAEEPRRKYILVFNSEPELVKFDLSELLDSDAFGYDDLAWGGGSWKKDYEVMRNKYEEKGYTARVSVLENLWFAGLSHAEHEEGGYHSERSFKDTDEILLGGRWKNETGGCNEMGHIWREIQASCCARLISYLFVYNISGR